MGDIWGVLPSSSSSSSSTSTSTSSSTPTQESRAVSILNPDSLVTHDLNSEKQICLLIPQVGRIVTLSDEMCEAAWELANYVPVDLKSNPSKDQLWNKLLIPKITQAIVDDVRARNAVERSFSAIVTLANAINTNAGLVRAARGSPTSVEVARKAITDRRDELKNCIESLSSLQNSAITLFSEHAREILQIVGPKAAAFADQEAHEQDIIDKLNQTARRLIGERAEAKAQVEKYNNLCHAQSVAVDGADMALQQTRERTATLQAMIKDGENAINSIPHKVSHTTNHSRRSFFGLIRDSWTETSQVSNHDRQAQVDYYTGIISARTARIKQMESDSQKVMKQQVELLAEYREKLEMATITLRETDERICKELSEIDIAIEIHNKKIDQIRKDADQTESLVGLKGSVLMQCLSAIRNFARTKSEHTCLYQPMVSVLEYVLSLTDGPVQLLKGNELEVFAAGVTLLKEVGFLHETSKRLREVSVPSQARRHAIEQARHEGLITDGADLL